MPEWDAVSPWASRGNCIPDCVLRAGYSFPMSAVPESASRNPTSERDAVSQWPSKRKLHPGIHLQSGTRFPVEPRLGNSVPFASKNGRPGCLSELPVPCVMLRSLACYVIPDDVVAVGENVVAASRHGRRAVDRVHPTARAAILLLGQTADRGDIRAVR